jgi:mucin-2
MIDGTYTLDYDLGGSNPLAAQQTIVTITGGIGSFTIPSTVLPNSGITVISFTKITNNGNSCFSLLNVATSLLINPLADIEATNLSATNVCFGNDVIVNVANATGLADGNYQFNYTIAGTTPTTGTTAVVPVISGSGQFTLAASLFITTGAQTITVTGIVASVGGCTNNNENAALNVTLYPIPTFTGASLAVQATCPNSDSTATISGATALSDGIYTILYNLSGANTAAAISATVSITTGVGTFTIPAANLPAGGITTISITSLLSTTSGCGGTVTASLDANFEVTTLAPPTLITDGNIFCDTNNPTIASLSLNIVGGQTVIWYSAATGGTALPSTDLLVNGTTYYAASVAASGCESATRLQVIANIKNCQEIKIPDGFSPNNDTINDTFVIGNLAELYPLFTLEIYNRYGNKVYQGNINTPNWDGTSSEGGLKLGDSLLPIGVYFFIINFNDGTREPLQDRVYLSR